MGLWVSTALHGVWGGVFPAVWIPVILVEVHSGELMLCFSVIYLDPRSDLVSENKVIL